MFELTQRGRVAVLRMTHGKANAMDLEFCRGLGAQIQAVHRSPAGALVLTGQGRMFSAGVDLPRLVAGGAAYVREFLPAMNHAFEALFAFPKPVVAAVNGHAIAGGCVMTRCADYRIMAREPGRIGIPELLVGVPFPVVPFGDRPVRDAAAAPAGADLSRPDAGGRRGFGYGLVDAVVDAEGLLEEAVKVAEGLAAVPFEAFHLTKRRCCATPCWIACTTPASSTRWCTTRGQARPCWARSAITSRGRCSRVDPTRDGDQRRISTR
jgi:enoyl-CoA hydratase